MKNKTLEKSGEATKANRHQSEPHAKTMDESDGEILDSAEPKVAVVDTQAHITSVSKGEPDVTEIDDVDLDLIDSDSLQALPPIASYDAILEFEGKVTQGRFAPMDDEEENFHFPIEARVVRSGSIRVIEKPMVFFEEEPLCEDENDFPPLVRSKLKGRAIVRGEMPNRFEPDEELYE